MHVPPASRSTWMALKRQLTQSLIRSAGIPNPQIEPRFKEHGEWRHPGHVVKSISYPSVGNLRVTAHLYLPDGPGEFPAILNLHGHTAREGKASSEVRQRCEALVRSGFVVLSVDTIGFGERRGASYPEHCLGGALLSTGITLLGLQVAENRLGIDLLRSLACVDGRRIGVTGESGGGNQAVWLAALDSRVRAAVPVVSAGTFAAYVTQRNCWCETLPDGLATAAEWSVLAMIAPRPLLVLSAAQETIPAFLPAEARKSVRLAGAVYRLLGAEARLAMRTVPGSHEYSGEMQRHMLGWFQKWLAGRGDGTPLQPPSLSPQPKCRFLCFTKKTRPRSFPTLSAYICREERQAVSRELRSAAEERRKLRRILRVPATEAAEVSRLSGRRTLRFQVASEGGARLPCTLTLPPPSHSLRGILLVISPGDSPDIPPGYARCLADLRDLGSNAWDHPEEHMRHTARSHLWTGRTLLGNWVHDIGLIACTLRAMFPHAPIELFASEETAVAGLASAALDTHFAAVVLENLPSTFATNGIPFVWNSAIHVPGVLRWGDVTLLAALSRCPLSIASLRHPSGKPLNAQETARWRREVKALCAQLGKSQTSEKTVPRNPVRARSGKAR